MQRVAPETFEFLGVGVAQGTAERGEEESEGQEPGVHSGDSRYLASRAQPGPANGCQKVVFTQIVTVRKGPEDVARSSCQ